MKRDSLESAVEIPDRYRARIEVSQAMFFSPVHGLREFLNGDVPGDIGILECLIFYAISGHDVDIGGFGKGLSRYVISITIS